MKPRAQSLAARITPTDLQDYLDRRVSSKELAKTYDVSVEWLVKCLPKRPPQNVKKAKSALRKVRNAFRNDLAKAVHEEKLHVKDAAKAANCTTRSMYRYLGKLKNA